MRRLPRSLLLLLPLLVGGALAAWWIRSVGGQRLIRGLLSAEPLFVVLALALTASWLFVRFIRWQFLLRRIGVRLPIRPTLHTYVAGLPGTATPAYVGEALRGVFLKRRFGVPMRLSLAVLVLERLYDVVALAALVAIMALVSGSEVIRSLQIAGVFVVLAMAAAATLWPVGRRVGIAADAMSMLRSGSTVLVTLVLSLAAWVPAALIISAAAEALGAGVGAADGGRIFAASTLLGALTLLPAGAGATGSVAIVELARAGMVMETAVLVVSLVRLSSTGAAIAVGSVFLWRELRSLRGQRPAEGAAHFDAIAEQYNAQWSPHVWDLLIERKIGFITEALKHPPAEAGVGLDLGCGLGLQTAALRSRGYQVIGLDPSVGLLAVGQRRVGPSLVLAGSALDLPFRDASLDFVYTIGVLHHLPGRAAQDQAVREIARVLKPGGVLLVHESNPRNPLFRFYMGYLFPILKSIDEGTEWWIDPRAWGISDVLHLEYVRYFTFLPDFTPRLLMRPALAVERLLERGPTRHFSAHYMAVLRRPLEAQPTPAPRVGEPLAEPSGRFSV
jgi:ubiquinone/menaquinone biosynthesis C-methylase UbiE/uncharacterized membrane protein YbhN (UPF0104 family)